MSHTLAAVFDNRADADSARQALISAGIGADAIRLNASDTLASGASTSATSTAGTHDESIGDSILHFFNKLFGDNDERVVYGEAVNRGNVVLTVQTDTQDEVERAADIVEGFGPTDIDEYRSQWQASGWTGAQAMRTTSPQLSASQQSAGLPDASLRSAGLQGDRLQGDGGALLQGSSQGGLSGSDSLQRAGSDLQDSSLSQDALQAGRRMTQRGGVRIYQPELGLGGNVDDDYYRGHWNSNLANLGGTFDEYAPAYRYGASMRDSDTYRGRSWDESETTLRSNWESHNPTSAWDKFKAAVRHGWERMTS